MTLRQRIRRRRHRQRQAIRILIITGLMALSIAAVWNIHGGNP